MQQLALHRVDTIVHRGDAHRLASFETIGVDEILVRQRCRSRFTRHRDRLFAAHLAQRAMAEAEHTAKPGGDFRVIVDQRRGNRRAAQEPQAMGHGKIGERRFTEEEIALLALQLALQCAHQCRPIVLGLLQWQPSRRTTGKQRATVGGESLGELRRHLGEAQRHRLGLEHQRHGMLEQDRVSPLRQQADIELLTFGQQRRGCLLGFQAASDQRGIAVDVGANLQHRRLAVAAGQRGEIGLGHQWRDHHRTPGQLLEAQHQAGLLGKRRGRVVMKDQLMHGALRVGSKVLSLPARHLHATA